MYGNSSTENDACFTSVETVVTLSTCCNVSGDENDASITAMEAGITKVVTAAYPVMKMTLVRAKSLAYGSHKMDMLLKEHISFINPTSIFNDIIFIQRKSTY